MAQARKIEKLFQHEVLKMLIRLVQQPDARQAQAAADRLAHLPVLPISIIRRRARLGPPAPGQPGPFSLGSPGAIEDAYRAAGFRDVEVKVVPAPLRMASTSECMRFERESFGALHEMLSGLDEAGREAAWDEIAEEMRRFERDGRFEAPCELVVASGVK